MKKVLRSGIDRRYVLLPLLVGMALVCSMYFVLEAQRQVTRNLTADLREREELMRHINELIASTMSAESSQRGYLLTAQPEYLMPYAQARAGHAAALEKLVPHYQDKDPGQLPILEAVRQSLAAKFAEMDRTIDMVRNGDSTGTLRVIGTNEGLQAMVQIRRDLEGLRDRESALVREGIARWNSQVRTIRGANLASTILTLVLLVAVGLLVSHEIKRRNHATKELELEVSLRTAELRELSEHMLKISEVEKSSLARELHDELGGLLVAMRMDFSQLKRKIQLPDATSEERWERIDKGLKMGVELKRRVIEGLRPTLLDNMGLVVALRWLAEQTCEQGNIKLVADLPEAEPDLGSDAVIAVFRTVQEVFSNVLKHSRATEVHLRMAIADDVATITVQDNGTGIPDGAVDRAGSHGLKQMKFRMQAIRGTFDVRRGAQGGTIATVRFPMSSNLRPRPAA